MTYKGIAPSLFLKEGKGVTFFDDDKVLYEQPVEAAKDFANYGADEIIIFDLSDTDEEHEHNLNVIRAISRVVDIPLIGAGNVRKLEDIKKLLYAGCKKAAFNMSKKGNADIAQEVCQRFGRDKLSCCVRCVEELESHSHLVKNYTSSIIIVDSDELENCSKWINKNCNDNANPVRMDTAVLFKKRALHEFANILRGFPVKYVSGGEINTRFKDFMDFKRQCSNLGIPVNTYESAIKWSEFKLNNDGMVPVIVQDYKTNDVLMLAYMNEEAFNKTIETGMMTYWSRSRNELWLKGETSGNYQYVKSLTADCDKDTILAKVLQIGAACHTGERSCFFNEMMRKEYVQTNPLKVFEDEYNVILDRKEHPKEGSYTNYLLDKGIDKILKKVGEECTEVIIAAKNPNPEELKYEIADWLYHAMVLMVERGVTWEEITKEISRR